MFAGLRIFWSICGSLAEARRTPGGGGKTGRLIIAPC